MNLKILTKQEAVEWLDSAHYIDGLIRKGQEIFVGIIEPDPSPLISVDQLNSWYDESLIEWGKNPIHEGAPFFRDEFLKRGIELGYIKKENKSNETL